MWDSPTCQRLPDGEINVADGLAYWKAVLETEWELVKSPFVMVHSLVTSGEYRATVKCGWHRVWNENWLDLGEELFIELAVKPVQEGYRAFVCDDPAGQAKALTSVFLSLAGSKHAKDTFRRPRRGGPDEPIEAPKPKPPVDAFCSFTPDTPVRTADGSHPIGTIATGTLVFGYNEATGTTGYYTVTAVWSHPDPIGIDLAINGAWLTTTPEHPFFTTHGWTSTEHLWLTDQIRSADGSWGQITGLRVRAGTQPMYNLTVAEAHTYFVGTGAWLVHNLCIGNLSPNDIIERAGVTNIRSTTLTLSQGNVTQLATDMQSGQFNWRSMKNPYTGQPEFIEIGISPSGQQFLLEGHHRFVAAKLADVPIPDYAVKRIPLSTEPPQLYDWQSITWDP